MRRLFLATGNPHKVREIAELLKGVDVALVLPKDCPGFPEVVEDQATIEGNARKKAVESARFCGFWALADDTGLEVEALGGAPGVYSARYSGPARDPAANTAKLLAELRKTPAPRRAVFRTVMALANPKGEAVCEEGRLHGEIALEPKGDAGFGYDPVFFVPRLKKTLAEMSLADKNQISHRALALSKMIPRVTAALGATAMLFCLSVRQARAIPTDQPPQTIWDQMMTAQSNEDVSQGYEDFSARRYELAAAIFSRAVATDPKNPDAHMMLGAAYYWLGRVDLSLQEYQTSLALRPDNAQAYILQGISLAYEDETHLAYQSFQKAVELDPNRPDSFMDLASLEEGLGKIPDALDHLRRAIALAPEDALYRFQLGALYYLLGRGTDARAALRKSLEIDPTFEDAWLELGAAQESDGNLNSAQASFRKALDLKGRDSVARLRLGRVLLQQGQSAQARRIFAGAFHLTPRDGGAGLQLSVSYSGNAAHGGNPAAQKNSGQPESAPAADIPPDDPLSVFARNLRRIPLDQDAVMRVQAVFMPRPKLIEAPSREPGGSELARALQQAVGGPPQAIQAVNRTYQIRAADPMVRARQIAEIMEDLRRTAAKAPAGSDVHLGMNLTFNKLQGVAANSSAGSGAASGPAPSSKVLYEPRQVGNDMGLWIIGVGWMSLVQETLPQPGAPPNHPDQTDWWTAEGLAHAALGQGETALADFSRAASLDPKNKSALLGLAVAYVISGNDAGAEETYRQILILDPKNRAARQGLEWLMSPVADQKRAIARGGHGG